MDDDVLAERVLIEILLEDGVLDKDDFDEYVEGKGFIEDDARPEVVEEISLVEDILVEVRM
jgi:hypothetical protein